MVGFVPKGATEIPAGDPTGFDMAEVAEGARQQNTAEKDVTAYPMIT
jgi:hypothetical protein